MSYATQCYLFHNQHNQIVCKHRGMSKDVAGYAPVPSKYILLQLYLRETILASKSLRKAGVSWQPSAPMAAQ